MATPKTPTAPPIAKRASRAAPNASPVLVETVVAFNVRGLHGETEKKRLDRLRKKPGEKRLIFGTALSKVLPPELVEPLAMADGFECKGSWIGLYESAFRDFEAVEQAVAGELGASPEGQALIWRRVAFEVAVRMAAAAFAKDPTGTPIELHHDLWAKRGGFGLFVKQMLRENGLTAAQLEDFMSGNGLGPPSFQKSQLQRWLYQGGVPQADKIRLVSEGIAGAAEGADAKRKAINPLRLRLRLHLFAGCLTAFEKIRVLVGAPRAEMMAAAFNMQVHRAFEAFQASARKPPTADGVELDGEAWLKERRMLARKAVLFGVGPATPGSWLLEATGDHDLATLSDPRWMLGGAQGEHRQRFEQFTPEIAAGQDAVRSVLRQLSLDDIVSDASGYGRQPLGWLGLIERVLRSRLPD